MSLKHTTCWSCRAASKALRPLRPTPASPFSTSRARPASDVATVGAKGSSQEQGSLMATSIFAAATDAERRRAAKTSTHPLAAISLRDKNNMAGKLDPQPERRRLWERRMVMQSIRRRGRLNKKLHLMRTEREITRRSPFFRTSVKKLMPLARQIAGKTVDDAIVQMQFSRKKVARDVREHLIDAKNHAIVERGMGLGRVGATDASESVKIRLKDGKKHAIDDKTKIYIEQAWVGRGPYGKATFARARGRVDLLRLPKTSITVRLKEEATRIREYNEREQREARRRVWVPMPDRPITAQRPYYCW